MYSKMPYDVLQYYERSPARPEIVSKMLKELTTTSKTENDYNVNVLFVFLQTETLLDFRTTDIALA